MSLTLAGAPMPPCFRRVAPRQCPAITVGLSRIHVGAKIHIATRLDSAPHRGIVDAEAPGGERRLRMIASFNRGYRGYQQSYRTCTPAAEVVIRRYLEEGSKIAREMTARYAN